MSKPFVLTIKSKVRLVFGTLFVAQAATAILTYFGGSEFLILAAIVIGLVICALGTLPITQSVLRPILRLTGMMDRLSHQDLAVAIEGASGRTRSAR